MGKDGSGAAKVLTAALTDGYAVVIGDLYAGAQDTDLQRHLEGVDQRRSAQGPHRGAHHRHAVDAKGLYYCNHMGDAEGVYKLGPDGKGVKVFDDSPLAGGVNGGVPRYITLDAARIYWFGGGSNNGQALLHALAR